MHKYSGFFTRSNSNVGKWAPSYRDVVRPQPYDDTTSYGIGAEWLARCEVIEDWGCGLGWLRTLIPPTQYRGIDGTASRFCDEVVDLLEYRSKVPGIFMRHVLEHNYEWARILDNAVASFTDRMALIVFTPEVDVTGEIAFSRKIGVPNIAFKLSDITERFPAGLAYTVHRIASETMYGGETILLCEASRS